MRFPMCPLCYCRWTKKNTDALAKCFYGTLWNIWVNCQCDSIEVLQFHHHCFSFIANDNSILHGTFRFAKLNVEIVHSFNIPFCSTGQFSLIYSSFSNVSFKFSNISDSSNKSSYANCFLFQFSTPFQRMQLPNGNHCLANCRDSSDIKYSWFNKEWHTVKQMCCIRVHDWTHTLYMIELY